MTSTTTTTTTTKAKLQTGFALTGRKHAAERARLTWTKLDQPGTGSKCIKPGRGRRPRWRDSQVICDDPEYGRRIIQVSVQPEAVLLKLKGRLDRYAVRIPYEEALRHGEKLARKRGGAGIRPAAKGAKQGTGRRGAGRQQEFRFDPPAAVRSKSKGGPQI